MSTSRELMNEFGPHGSYWIGRLVRPRLLPGGDCNKRLCLPQGIKANGCGDTGGITDVEAGLGYTTAVPASSKVGEFLIKRTYQPKKRYRRRVHGFLRRMASRGGARVVQNRRRKGRQRLTP
jgi:large subunit ribosomal protein L34